MGRVLNLTDSSVICTENGHQNTEIEITLWRWALIRKRSQRGVQGSQGKLRMSGFSVACGTAESNPYSSGVFYCKE
jgi:hypothetical protein